MHYVLLDNASVVDWRHRILLTASAKQLLQQIAGQPTDFGFWSDYQSGVNCNFDGEPWAWGLVNRPSHIWMWFRDPRHATYFKTLWGGR